jgi:ornithine carbamoyltransferase
MKKDLLTLQDITEADLNTILELSTKLKADRQCSKSLTGKSVGVIFAKSSTRTRVSFEVGVSELGGTPLILDQSKTQIGRGETIEDTARVLSRYLHAIVIRTYSHTDIEKLAENATIPVINALTDEYHPCQVLADLFTIYELTGGNLKGKSLAFMGDGASNMSNSLILGGKLAGMDVRIGAPKEFKPSDEILNTENGSGTAKWFEDPYEAVAGADFIYTDVFVSMGFEEESEKRLKTLLPYQVNSDLMLKAAKNAKVLHCLPAHRGEEITHEVLESDQSVVFEEAENRLHVQKAVMELLIK